LYRAIDPGHLKTALRTKHTSGTRSRFNGGHLLKRAQRYESLYFADDPTVAAFESGAMLGQPWKPGGTIPHPRKSHYTILNIEVILHEVVDLVDVDVAQNPLETNVQELTGDWYCYYNVRDATTTVQEPTGITPTQMLGWHLFRTGIEGFWTVSAKVPYHRNLIVFPQNLRSGHSRIVFRNPKDPTGPPLHQIV
jgi:hypothetical protein